MKNHLMLFASLSLFATSALAEDYQCGDDAGCKGSITEDGEIREEIFRKGDMVSTDAGWRVSTDDGWVKIKTHGSRTGGTRGAPKFGFTLGEVMLWTPAEVVGTNAYAVKVPTTRAQFLRPVVSLAAQPPELCLIGL